MRLLTYGRPRHRRAHLLEARVSAESHAILPLVSPHGSCSGESLPTRRAARRGQLNKAHADSPVRANARGFGSPAKLLIEMFPRIREAIALTWARPRGDPEPQRADIVMKSRAHHASKNVKGPCTVPATRFWPFACVARPVGVEGS